MDQIIPEGMAPESGSQSSRGKYFWIRFLYLGSINGILLIEFNDFVKQTDTQHEKSSTNRGSLNIST